MNLEVANTSDTLNCSTQFTSFDDDVETCRNYYHGFEYEFVHRILVVVVPLFFGIIGILGLVGNLLVVVVVAANPGMRSTTNILIINLAVADLLFVMFCIPFTATDFVLPYWPFGNVWCKIVQYMIIVTAYASVYTLILMSLDRYLAVVHPIASMSWRTETHAIHAICILWVMILTMSIPAFVIHGEIHYIFQGQNLTACRILDQYDWTSYQVPFFLSSYVMPLVLICVFYMFMLARLWRGVRTSAENRRGRRRVTRLVVIVVVVFAFCWCPIQMILVLKSLDMYPLTTATIMVQIVSHILAYTNSCINPFLYAFLSDHFRKAFRKIIYCRPTANSDNQMGPATRTTRAASAGDIL
ncbi:Allatostatin-A receptor [Trachymyrmex septentrionalis]|uniref:Allatostatin-A receptor n=1 Tax=Trachymyrmex septentrionalis TaxID=34720 RepID=A0A195FUR0_9HYME|nr:PREDICTED: allatostatin-A receptor [Trachymyrmex septentrionalis]KYN44385.1 Allatostatin-A receptor [Trachymyrmex septentrionalis]